MNFGLWPKSRHLSRWCKVEGHLDFARCERELRVELRERSHRPRLSRPSGPSAARLSPYAGRGADDRLPARLYVRPGGRQGDRSEEHTPELQPLMRNSHAVFCLKKKNTHIISI